MNSSPRPFTLDRVVRMVITIVYIVAALWLISRLKSVLLPFLIAWLIAYLLEPFVQYNKKLLRVKNRWFPIVMTLFECVLIACAFSIFIVPTIMEQMQQLAALVSNYAKGGSSIPFIPESVHEYIRNKIDFQTIYTHLTRQDIEAILDAFGSVLSGGYNVVMEIVNIFFILLYVVFIMLDYERLIKGFQRMVPPQSRDVVFKIGGDIKNAMNQYFRGQSLVALCVGILFCIGFSIIGLPMAIVLGLFIGVLNLVPYLQLISLVPTTLLCLVMSVDADVQFWPMWWSCMLVYAVVQVIQDMFLTPKIMGKSMGLNPAIILLSLSIWGTLLGIIGLIIALPATTLILSYYNLYINRIKDPTPVIEK